MRKPKNSFKPTLIQRWRPRVQYQEQSIGVNLWHRTPMCTCELIQDMVSARASAKVDWPLPNFALNWPFDVQVVCTVQGRHRAPTQITPCYWPSNYSCNSSFFSSNSSKGASRQELSFWGRSAVTLCPLARGSPTAYPQGPTGSTRGCQEYSGKSTTGAEHHISTSQGATLIAHRLSTLIPRHSSLSSFRLHLSLFR